MVNDFSGSVDGMYFRSAGASIGGADREWLKRLGVDYPELPEGMYARSSNTPVRTMNEEQHSFECTVATEARVLMPDWQRMQMVEEVLLMSGADYPERGVPLLNSHQRYAGCAAVYGSTRDLRVENKELIGRNFFDAGDPEAMRAYGKYKDGHLNGFSVGYRVTKAVYIEPGKSKDVDGRTWTAGKLPLRLAVRWQVLENSCVVIGADSNAISRSLDFSNNEEGVRMDFIAWCKRLGINPDGLSAGQRAALEDMFSARCAGVTGEPDAALLKTLQERAALIMAPAEPAPTNGNEGERGAGNIIDFNEAAQRVATDAMRLMQQRTAEINAIFEGYDFPELRQRAINENMTPDAVRSALLKAVRESRGTPMTHVPCRPETMTDQIRTMEAALLMTSGQLSEERVAKDYGDQTLELVRKDFRGLGLRQFVELYARMSGHHVPYSFGDETIRIALQHAREIEGRSGTGMSNFSLPGIMSNVANKIMLAAYASVPGVADKLCGTGTASDFKPTMKYRIIDGGQFELVADGGDLRHGSFGEESFTNQVETFGRIDFITRKMMYNDDLQALNDISNMYGRNAALLKEQLFFGCLLDALSDTSFFAANVNRFGGEDTVFGLPGLKTLDLAFEERTDKADNPINVAPKYLLAPSPLKADVLSFFSTEKFGDMGDAGSGTAVRNPYYQYLTPITSAYLSKLKVRNEKKKELKAHTNASEKRWFGFADPAVIAAFEMIYLGGRKAPVFEKVDADPSVLAIGMRGYWDINCGKQDPVAVAAMDGE